MLLEDLTFVIKKKRRGFDFVASGHCNKQTDHTSSKTSYLNNLVLPLRGNEALELLSQTYLGGPVMVHVPDSQ